MRSSVPALSLLLVSVTASAAQPMNLLAPFEKFAERAQILKKIELQAERLGLSASAFSNSAFEVNQVQENLGMRTVKTEMKTSGIPVVGAGISYHVSSNGDESYTASLPLVAPNSIVPKISEREALAIASLRSVNPLTAKPILKLFPSTDRSRVDLVWWIDFRSTDAGSPGVEVIIDAMNGKVIGEISKLQTAQIEVYNAHESGMALALFASKDTPKGTPPKVAGCVVIDLETKQKAEYPPAICAQIIKGQSEIGANACQMIKAVDGSFYNVNPRNCELYSADGRVSGSSDASAANATSNANTVYNFYSNRFGRRSYDGQGSVLQSVVKVGYGWSNAAWLADKNFMVYGFGDGKEMGDFTQLVDVSGHEMTHGIVNTTAQLSMMDEPGALNEATADYFGIQIANNNEWTIGKGLYLQHPDEGLRSISNPTSYQDSYVDEAGKKITQPNPDKYSVRYQTTGACGVDNDRCFVHMNSTIMSHGYYLMNQALGNSKTQDLLFVVLTQYYRSNTNLHEAGALVREACATLMKQGRLQGDDCSKVNDALTQVEL